VVEALLCDSDVLDFLHVNRYREVLWFGKERFEDLLGGLLVAAVTRIAADAALSAEEAARELAARQRIVAAIRKAECRSGYQVEQLLRLLAA
jgi:hypothetical protein